MTGLETTIAAFSGLVSVGEKLVGAKGEADKQALLVDFQRSVIAAQGMTMELQNKLAGVEKDKAALEAQVADFLDWNSQIDRYELREVSQGIFCRFEKDAKGDSKSLFKYCASCFEDRTKSPLQYQAVPEGRFDSLVCLRCKSKLVFRGFRVLE